MTNLWKRTTAFALMICMVLCAVPAVAFAQETEPAQMDSITYNFGAIRDHSFTYYNPDTDEDITTTYSNVNVAEISIKGRALKAELERLYNEGQSNWCYDSASAEIGRPNFNIYASGRNSEMYLQARNTANAHLKDVYFAFRIQSPGTGEYKMTLDTALVATGVAGSAYILPSSVTDIDGALTEAAYVGSFSCYGDKTVKNSIVALDNTVSLKAGKDYLLVITVDSANEGDSHLFMNSVTLDVVKNLDSITYDFYLGDNTDLKYGTSETAFTNVNILNTADAKTALDAYYEAGTLDWKYLSDDVSHAIMRQSSYASLYVYNSVSSSFTTGNYFAVSVRSPGTGNYQMTFNYGQAKIGSTKGGVYLFDASVDPAAWKTAEPLFSDSVSYSYNANNANSVTTTFDAAIPMEAGKNYTLVFTNEGAVDSSFGGSAINAMFIKGVTLDKVATLESLNTIEYDFRLDTLGLKYTNTAGQELAFAGRNITELNSAGTAFGSTTLLVHEAIANYYTAGTLNWKMHSATGTHFSIGSETTTVNWKNDCTYMYNKMVDGVYTAGHYYAMTVRSPGTGDYDVTLNYATSKNGAAQGSVYLLAADADLATALTPENALGTVDFEEGTNAYANDATTTFDKTVTMDAGKEYLLVFKCDQVGAVLNAMYLNSMVLKNTASYIVDGAYYDDFNEANWAALDGGMTVELNRDAVLGEVRTAGTSIDLNGYTLTVDALTGSVIDSSEGNTGLLATDNGNVVFSENNADIPLYDTAAGGYRLFDYTLELHETVEPVGTVSQKFWFKFHFRASDAEDAALDQDAYDLVAAGGSDFQISTELTWNKEALDTVYFGRNYEGLETAAEKIDAFSKEWADGATSSRWLYVTVSGLGSDMEGTLTVKPVFTANGVQISNGSLSYTCAAA